MALKAVTLLCVPTQELITSVLINNKCKVLNLLKKPHYMFVFRLVILFKCQKMKRFLVILSYCHVKTLKEHATLQLQTWMGRQT